MHKNKVLLITGGTGSFGNVVLERFLDSDIKEIRIFSRDEKKQDDMRKLYKNDKLKFYIGDVRNYESIYDACIGVDYIFHAAALKQVPSCEFFPMEAVRTNVLGTENVLNAAISTCVKKVVCLSTDKAAYPINAMGISKAMMEKVAASKSLRTGPAGTLICITRYGNVMASRGSVIPLFVEQIKNNMPLTITDPSMTRFLMSLEEAVNLVMFAFDNASQGDMFVQKSPACSVIDLANALKKIFKSDSKIKILGSRHGEKLHETLLTREEKSRSVDLGQYYKIVADSRELNYDKYLVDGGITNDLVEYTSQNTVQLDLDGIVNKLLETDYIKKALMSVN